MKRTNVRPAQPHAEEPFQYGIEDLLKRIALILLFSLTWGLGVPGVIAVKTGTFSEESLRRILPDAADKKLRVYEQRKANLTKNLEALDTNISDARINRVASEL